MPLSFPVGKFLFQYWSTVPALGSTLLLEINDPSQAINALGYLIQPSMLMWVLAWLSICLFVLVLVFARPRILVLVLSGRRHQWRVTREFFSPTQCAKNSLAEKQQRGQNKLRPSRVEFIALLQCLWVKRWRWECRRGLGGTLEAAPGTAVKMAIYHFVFKRGAGEKGVRIQTENQMKNQTKLNRTKWNEMKGGMWATYF